MWIIPISHVWNVFWIIDLLRGSWGELYVYASSAMKWEKGKKETCVCVGVAMPSRGNRLLLEEPLEKWDWKPAVMVWFLITGPKLKYVEEICRCQWGFHYWTGWDVTCWETCKRGSMERWASFIKSEVIHVSWGLTNVSRYIDAWESMGTLSAN